MVATVVGLRLRSMGHLLVRERWRQIVVIASLVWMLTLVPGVLWMRGSLASGDIENRYTALVALATAFAIGWAFVPIMVAGGDDTLDARRFATFGADVRRIMPGIAVSGLLTLPALFFVALWVTLATTWAADGPAVVALAVFGALVQVASYVALARVSSMWAARAFSTRRTRTFALAASSVVVAGAGYLAWRALGRGLAGLFETDFTVLIDAIERTPLASAISAPAAAARGEWWSAAWRMGLAVVWVVALLFAWRANVAYALLHPVYRSGATRARRDAVVRAGASTFTLRRADRRGPAGAVYTRLLRSWRSDPRYVSGVATILVMPAVFVALIVPAFGLDPRWSYAAPFVLAASIGWGRHNDVALDSSALWLDIVAGRRGGAVMRGRFSAVTVWALPFVVVVALAVAGWTEHWELAPALVGASIGTLGSTLGVAAIASVTMPYRTPAPGENPFHAEVGSVGAGFVAQLASSAATVVVVPFAVVPCILAVVVDARWGIVATVGGLVIGIGGYLAALHVAGRIYDSRSGSLLAAVR